MRSWRSSRGRSSVIDRASIDFPVPGSPIRRTCRVCSDAFLMTSTEDSCPMTWSTRRSGILISAVLRNSWLRIHKSMASGSSEPERVSAMYPVPQPNVHVDYVRPSIKSFRRKRRGRRPSRASGGPSGRSRRNHLCEPEDARLDVVTRFRTREQERGLVGVRERFHVSRRDFRLVPQLRLVCKSLHRYVPRHAVHRGDPVVQFHKRLLPRDVADRQDPLGPVEVRLLEELPEPLLTHDVPDRHVEGDLAIRPRVQDDDLLL